MIKVENLTKYYGTRLAVDNISFQIEKGAIVGFLGPNGAGKTTTMRILTGFMAPSSGSVSIAGYDVSANSLEARRHIGYLPEAVPLYTDMTVRAYLDFLARLRGLDNNRRKQRIAEVTGLCHLEEYSNTIIGKLSKGYRQRVGIAQAIIHEPEVLILDEPTVGIDPIQVAMTRQLIKELGKERTILLSTHILPEVSMICERVIIIHEGRIVAEDSIENLSHIVGGSRRIRLQVEGPADRIIDSLSRIAGVQRVSRENERYLVESTREQDPRSEIMQVIVRNGWTLLAMESVEMSLEDIFLKLTTEEEPAK